MARHAGREADRHRTDHAGRTGTADGPPAYDRSACPHGWGHGQGSRQEVGRANGTRTGDLLPSRQGHEAGKVATQVPTVTKSRKVALVYKCYFSTFLLLSPQVNEQAEQGQEQAEQAEQAEQERERG